MNEIEHLIADLPRPEPSQRLDESVMNVLNSSAITPWQRKWSTTLMWCVTAASVGLLGFFVGRQSVPQHTNPTHRMSTAPAQHSFRSSSANVVQMPLDEEHLASFFMPASSKQSLLGNGPLTLTISSSP